MNATARYPHVKYRSESSGSVSGAGTLLLTETARALGLVEALEVELGGFMRPNAVHHPGKAVCDLAVMLAAGGDCPADVAMLRARPHLFGMVASDPTMSRIVDDLARDPGTAIAGIAAARAQARAAAGLLPGGALPLVDGHVIVDIDATLVASHSEKELAAPNYKRGFGFHPILAFADHGAGGTGTPLAAILRPGNAGSNTATDHVAVTALALAQLDSGQRDRVLVRADSAGGTKAFTHHLADAGLAYSVGFPGFLAHLKAAIDTVEESAWVPAIDAGGQPRDGAWVAEITGLLDLGDWPAGMRVVARKERAHPGAQLTLTDTDGHRVTCFATNDPSPGLPALEARHRHLARCEDRIKDAKDTGAGEPALLGRRLQRHLDPGRPARHGPHRLGPAARPHRDLARRPAQGPAPQALLDRRTVRHHRTPPDPRHRPSLALGSSRPRRPQAPRMARPTRTRLTPPPPPDRPRPEPRRPPPGPTGRTPTPPNDKPPELKTPPQSPTPTKSLG